MTTNTEEVDLDATLWQAFRQNYHLDNSNAAVHCAGVRYSPLTFRLAEALYSRGVLGMEIGLVIGDRGAYEEDRGR